MSGVSLFMSGGRNYLFIYLFQKWILIVGYYTRQCLSASILQHIEFPIKLSNGEVWKGSIKLHEGCAVFTFI